MTGKTRYQAPALKKGLEILELLAGSAEPLIMSDISTALGRSVSEIFRMLQVLEEHGYIARSEDGYALTNRLFSLGMSHPPIGNLVLAATPVLQDLADEAGQSCHLAVASGAEIVIILAIEAPGLSGFAVRVGYRRPLHQSNSGRILMAWQRPAVLAQMIEQVRAADPQLDEAALAERLAAIAAAGGATEASPIVTGITDVSAPILVGGIARAALTIPYLEGRNNRASIERCGPLVRDAAARIGQAMAPVAQARTRGRTES